MMDDVEDKDDSEEEDEETPKKVEAKVWLWEKFDIMVTYSYTIFY